MIRDIFLGFINSDLSKYLVGALIGLLGPVVFHYFSEIKSKKDKKEEILENMQMLSANYFSYLAMIRFSDDLVNYFSQCFTGSNTTMNKEETQRWLAFSVTSLEKLINVSGDLNKTYMSYKIHYGKDQELKSLINDLVSSSELDFGLESYEITLDLKVLKEIRARNNKKMKEKVKELLQPKKDNLVNYLDEKIKEIPTRTG